MLSLTLGIVYNSFHQRNLLFPQAWVEIIHYFFVIPHHLKCMDNVIIMLVNFIVVTGLCMLLCPIRMWIIWGLDSCFMSSFCSHHLMPCLAYNRWNDIFVNLKNIILFTLHNQISNLFQNFLKLFIFLVYQCIDLTICPDFITNSFFYFKIKDHSIILFAIRVL